MILFRVENEVISSWLPSDSHISCSLYNSLNLDLYMCFLLPRQHFPAPSSPLLNPHSAITGSIQGRWLLGEKKKHTKKRKTISPGELARLCARPSGNRDPWPLRIERFCLTAQLASPSGSHCHVLIAGATRVERIQGGLKDENLAKRGAFVWLINSRCAVGL